MKAANGGPTASAATEKEDVCKISSPTRNLAITVTAPPLWKKKVEKSESSIKKLKEHTEKKTCPKDLRYNVRVNIVPDDEFESGISHIRREAEQKLIGALTRYHHRRQKPTKSSSNIWSKDQTQPEERKRTILI